MVLQPNVDDPKAPVSIIRTAEDAKTVVLSLYVGGVDALLFDSYLMPRNFKACNRDQLLDLRKLMQVSKFTRS